MKNQWEVWPKAFSEDYCDEIVKRSMDIMPQSGQIGFENSTQDLQHRTSTIRWLDVDHKHKDIAEALMYFIKKSNRNNFGFNVTEMNEIQFTEYHGTKNGKYDWHHDVHWENTQPYDRKLSIVVQLTDHREYEGGEFEFFGAPPVGTNFRNKGDVLIFPSFFMHRVLPVTSGVRYSLVSWIEGPKWS